MLLLNEKGYCLEDNLMVALAACGRWLEPSDKILDFGCGAGATVCNLRKKGLQAFGFDIKNYLSEEAKLRSEWFTFQENTEENSVDFRIGKAFSLPYPDNAFDLVLSTTTIEHLSDLPVVAAELARVTKPNGVNLHVFPPKRCLFDTHTFVPLSSYSMFQTSTWFFLMALCGIRDEYQTGLSARETALRNLRYCKTALFYRTDQDILNIFSQHFSSVSYEDEQYYVGIYQRKPFLERYQKALSQENRIRNLAYSVRMKVLFAVK